MDKIKKYQDLLIAFLNDYVDFLSGSNASVKPQVFTDCQHNHFQLLKIGWDTPNQRFVFGVLFHIDIIDEKIWLQLNNTEFQLIDELIERGVPKNDIIIGFQPPFMHDKIESVATA